MILSSGPSSLDLLFHLILIYLFVQDLINYLAMISTEMIIINADFLGGSLGIGSSCRANVSLTLFLLGFILLETEEVIFILFLLRCRCVAFAFWHRTELKQILFGPCRCVVFGLIDFNISEAGLEICNDGVYCVFVNYYFFKPCFSE